MTLRTLCGAVLILAAGRAGPPAAYGRGLNARVSESAQAHLAQGNALLRAGDFQRAREEFKTTIRLNPQSVQARVLLGVAENQLGNFREAIPAFREALHIDPHSEAAHYNLALSLLRLGKNDEAIQEFEEVLKLNPKVGPAHYNLGLLLAQKGLFKQSIEHLEAARAERPNDAAVLVHLVDAYFKTRQDGRALQLAKEEIQTDSSGSVSARLGVLLTENGHSKEAVPALEKAQHSAPDSPELAVHLARAYLASSQAAQAIELLTPFVQKKPSWQVHYLLGLAYRATAQPEAAACHLLGAANLKPDEAAVHFSLGTLLLKTEDQAGRKAGVDEIQRAINLDSHQSEYYVTLGKWLLDRYELGPAITLVRRALENVPPSVELYLMLGLAEAELHGSAAARPIIEKAIQLDPQVGPAFNLLGNCYLRVGDYANATKYYKKAADLNPQNDLYFYDVALALERLNKPEEAIAYAERSTQLNPDGSLNHYLLGKLYAKAGRKAEAARELETGVRLDPKIEYPYYLLARTYMQMGDQAKAQEWSRKLRDLKAAKDRVVGLAGPASESTRTLQPSEIPSSARSPVADTPP